MLIINYNETINDYRTIKGTYNNKFFIITYDIPYGLYRLEDGNLLEEEYLDLIEQLNNL
jgi:hypothetical protein